MKTKIHPKYNEEAIVTCACGNTFKTGSTEEKLEVEICSMCHPFYTGKSKLVDTAGVVDKFKSKLDRAKTLKEGHAKVKEARAKRAEEKAAAEEAEEAKTNKKKSADS